MEHTPGPWEVVEMIDYNHGHKYVDGYRVQSVNGDPNEPVAEMSGFEKAEANANLIAAAPDLLEALEDMTAWVKSVGCGCQRCIKSLAAIAKARGEKNG